MTWALNLFVAVLLREEESWGKQIFWLNLILGLIGEVYFFFHTFLR